MEIVNNTNILSEHGCQVFCRHSRQFSSKQLRQNESPKSNVGINQTQGQRITIEKKYYQEKQRKNEEFILIEKNKLKENIFEIKYKVFDRVY